MNDVARILHTKGLDLSPQEMQLAERRAEDGIIVRLLLVAELTDNFQHDLEYRVVCHDFALTMLEYSSRNFGYAIDHFNAVKETAITKLMNDNKEKE